MSYVTVENGLMTLLRTVSGYTAVNTSIGDWRILGKGIDKALVLNPGSIPERNVTASPRRIRNLWVIEVDLLVAFQKDLSEAAGNIRTERQAIMDKIDQYPTLNQVSGVINAFITGASAPDIFVPRGGSRRWWVETLICEVEERVNTTIAEA